MEQQTASFMNIVVIVYIWSDQAPEVLGPSLYSRLKVKGSYIPLIFHKEKLFIGYDRMDAPIVSGVHYMLLVFHYYYVSPVGGSALL